MKQQKDETVNNLQYANTKTLRMLNFIPLGKKTKKEKKNLYIRGYWQNLAFLGILISHFRKLLLHAALEAL